jgi:hypothetical protein
MGDFLNGTGQDVFHSKDLHVRDRYKVLFSALIWNNRS